MATLLHFVVAIKLPLVVACYCFKYQGLSYGNISNMDFLQILMNVPVILVKTTVTALTE